MMGDFTFAEPIHWAKVESKKWSDFAEPFAAWLSGTSVHVQSFRKAKRRAAKVYVKKWSHPL